MIVVMPWAQSGFSERLDQAVEKTGLSQKDFAKKHGINPVTLSAWKERNQPGYDEVLNLAAGLKVRPAWLIFDDDFEPMDDEELRMIRAFRRMREPEREALQTLLDRMNEGREESKKPGRRTADLPQVKLMEEATRLTPSDEPASESHKSETLHLPQDELKAALAWILREVKTMPAERPLTKACRKIATRIARDNAPASSAKTQDQSQPATAAHGKDAPSAAAPSPHRSRHKS